MMLLPRCSTSLRVGSVVLFGMAAYGMASNMAWWAVDHFMPLGILSVCMAGIGEYLASQENA